jgi:glycosyltransferase involved in cell wall biosynthesis
MSAHQPAKPLITVVIPMYNHAKYVEQCLDSIRDNLYRPVEIRVMDDGSSDNSYEIAGVWAARNAAVDLTIHVMRQANKGINKTLNTLVQMAQGDFIAVIASDDYLLPGSLQIRLNALRQNPNWLIVFGDGKVINEKNEILQQSCLSGFIKANKQALLHSQCIAMEMILQFGTPGGSFMARREAYDPKSGLGLYDENLLYEDRDYFLRGLARNQVGFIDAVVSAYRQHGRNSTDKTDPAALAKYYYGRYQSEQKNLRYFSGFNWLALRMTSWLSLAIAKKHEQNSRKNRFLVQAAWKSCRLLYLLHRQRVPRPRLNSDRAF